MDGEYYAQRHEKVLPVEGICMKKEPKDVEEAKNVDKGCKDIVARLNMTVCLNAGQGW